MLLSVFLDLVVIGLLIATISYAALLNRRLNVLRDSKEDMSRLMDSFFSAITAAQASVDDLKKAANSAAGNLKSQVNEAKGLYSDLSFMVERANILAANLENMIAAERHLYKPLDQAPSANVRPLFKKEETDQDVDFSPSLKDMR